MANRHLTKAKATKASLLKEKKTFGGIMDKNGSRYYIPVLLLKARELEEGKKYYAWFQREFPDDCGEPFMFVQWLLMFYLLGEHKKALQMARTLIHQNIHAIPFLLGQPLARLDNFWYGSNYADPAYISEAEISEMALPADFILWLNQEYAAPKMQTLIKDYISLRQKLNAAREVEERQIILNQENELFAEKPIPKNEFVYQLKITLEEIEPPVWRRILVTADTKLPALHRIIQTAFGWTNSHMHQFAYQNTFFTTDNYAFTSIKDILHIEKQSFEYEYDFGDSWLHTIVLENILPLEETQALPVCTDGERRGPPDDCGGADGYTALLEIFLDKTHEEYADIKEWLGKGFNPEKFSLLSVNKKLLKKNYGLPE